MARNLLNNKAMIVYLVDDDVVFKEFLTGNFPGLRLRHFRSPKKFFQALQEALPDKVIVDLLFDKVPRQELISKIPEMEGLAISLRLKEKYPQLPVLVVSRYATFEIVSKLKEEGIPFLDSFASEERAKEKIREFLGVFPNNRKKEELSKIREIFASHGFLTSSQFLLSQLAGLNLSPLNYENVLLVGETGTGKTFLARILHSIIFGKDYPFQELNLTRIPSELIESELFGFEKGAFTGASQARSGYLELANRGTLLIDEIGYLNFQQQGKLLNAIEGNVFYRVGGSIPRRVKVKIIGATSLQPYRRLREDLLFRFSNVVHLPPLRERREDVELFIEAYKEKGLELTASAENFLKKADYPGNLRMLKNLLDKFLSSSDRITLDEAAREYEKWMGAFKKEKDGLYDIAEESEEEEIMDNILDYLTYKGITFKELEREFLNYLLNKRFKVKTIASLFGVSRATVFRLKLELERERKVSK